MNTPWDPDIEKMNLTAVEKNGLQIFRNYSRAIEENRRDRLVQKLDEGTIDLSEFERFAFVVSSEPALSVAVVACAYADELMKEMFKREIPASVPGGRNELLSGFGPLSRLSQRVQIAYAFGWMSADILVELDHLRKIRNDISHKWDLVMLNSKLEQMVEQKQLSIETYLADGVNLPSDFHLRLTPVGKFRVRVLWLIARVLYESHYYVHAVKQRIDPARALYSEKPPRSLGEISGLCVRYTNEIVKNDAG